MTKAESNELERSHPTTRREYQFLGCSYNFYNLRETLTLLDFVANHVVFFPSHNDIFADKSRGDDITNYAQFIEINC